eukprot:832235-Amphidinium_carterae.1
MLFTLVSPGWKDRLDDEKKCFLTDGARTQSQLPSYYIDTRRSAGSRELPSPCAGLVDRWSHDQGKLEAHNSPKQSTAQTLISSPNAVPDP